MVATENKIYNAKKIFTMRRNFFCDSVKCSRERIAEPWKKGYFQRKKARKKAPVEESCDEEDESSS